MISSENRYPLFRIMLSARHNLYRVLDLSGIRFARNQPV